MANAKSILVAGAGIVGVEVVGELAVKWAHDKSKRVGICVKGDRLLPKLPAKAGRLAHDFLRERNVEIFYNTTLTPTSGRDLGFEAVVPCLGYKFHTDFLQKNFESCLAPNG